MSVKILGRELYTKENIEELLTLLKSIDASLDTQSLLNSPEIYCNVKFPIETKVNTNYRINKEFLNFSDDMTDLEFFNELIWIHISSQSDFKKQIKQFNNIYDEMCKDEFIINFNNNVEFLKVLAEKTNASSFEEYRDNFYDDFGIDIIEYYYKVIFNFKDDEDEDNNDEEKDKDKDTRIAFKMLKNTDKKFYPYKLNQIIHYDFTTTHPIHKLIKKYTSYVEVYPYVKDEFLNELIQKAKKNMKTNFENLTNLYGIFHHIELDETPHKYINKEQLLTFVEKNKNRLKKAIIIYDIMKYHNMLDYKSINTGIRLFNFYLMKEYSSSICVKNEDNKIITLQDYLNNPIYESVEIILNTDVELNLIKKNAILTKIKMLVKFFIQEFD